MAASETAEAPGSLGEKFSQQRRGERRMQSGEALEIEIAAIHIEIEARRAVRRTLTETQAKLDARRTRDIAVELAHLSRKRCETAAQSRREVALERRQQLDTHAVTHKALMRIAAVVHETRADRIQIAQDFEPPDTQHRPQDRHATGRECSRLGHRTKPSRARAT